MGDLRPQPFLEGRKRERKRERGGRLRVTRALCSRGEGVGPTGEGDWVQLVLL